VHCWYIRKEGEDISSDSSGLVFRDKILRSPKRDISRPHLSEPEESLNAMMPYLKEIGLTRFADITGLRTSGIPAVNAVRPTRNNPSVSHGKGLTLSAAMASAAGESIERYCCFNTALPAIRSSYNELKSEFSMIPADRLGLSKFSLFNENMNEGWILGWDILNREEVPVPYSTVSIAGQQFSNEIRSFQSTSNGLAYGEIFLEALAQAVEEVIERDAVACTDMAIYASEDHISRIKVDLSTITYDTVNDLIRKTEAAGFETVLLDCTIDTATPVYNCLLFDERKCYLGSGASLSPEISMIRALTESVLASAVIYSGVRDVYFRDERYIGLNLDSRREMARFISAEPGISALDLKSRKTMTFEEDIKILMKNLQAAGISQLIAVDLSESGMPGSVVKVVAPGLEGYHHYYAYHPGYRALGFLKRTAL